MVSYTHQADWVYIASIYRRPLQAWCDDAGKTAPVVYLTRWCFRVFCSTIRRQQDADCWCCCLSDAPTLAECDTFLFNKSFLYSTGLVTGGCVSAVEDYSNIYRLFTGAALLIMDVMYDVCYIYHDDIAIIIQINNNVPGELTMYTFF